MQKKELRKLKGIYATRTMERIAKDPEMGKVKMMLRCQSQGKILMVCVFRRKDVADGIRAPLYEIYLNPEGMEYITWENSKTGGRWLTGMLENLEYITWDMCYMDYYYGKESDKKWWQNKEGRNTIQTMLGTKEKGWSGIIEWQRRAKKEQNEQKEKRELAPWDKEMKLVPELPKTFPEWIRREAMQEYFLFYQYKDGGAKEAYCSRCRRWVGIKEIPKNNEKAVCPACRTKAKYKVLSRIGTLAVNSKNAELIQRVRGGYVIRCFNERHYYTKNRVDPRIGRSEVTRTMLMDDGAVRRYCYGLYKNRIMRWNLDKGYRPEIGTYYENTTTILYQRNLGMLKKGPLCRSAIGYWETLPTSTGNYLALEKAYPVIEMVVKIGMMTLAEDIIKRTRYGKEIDRFIDTRKTELAKMLLIDRQRLNRLKEMGKSCGIETLEWMQMEKASDTIWPDEMIKELGEEKIEPSDLGYLTPPTDYRKAYRYLRKQADMEDETLYQTSNTWRDYLAMAEMLKMDTTKEYIWKPKDLKAAHDELVELRQREGMEKEADKIRKKWKKVEGILPELKKFEYEDKNFLIRAPESVLDIVREGRILRHCVHTCEFYFDRIECHETYLFFLRRKKRPDTPWYTIEMEAGGNIRQKRTVGDNQNEDLKEAEDFLKKWQQAWVRKMNKKEKKYGERADEKRREEYAKLRLEGNRVWHGRLAGQLLADVLEADFMPVEMQMAMG